MTPPGTPPSPLPQPVAATRARSRWRSFVAPVGGLLVGVGLVVALVLKPEPPPSEVQCAGAEEAVVLERDRANGRVVYECSNGASTRRWTVVGPRITQVIDYAGGVPHGPAVYFDGLETRTDGEFVHGAKSGTWRVFEHGVLIRTQEWKQGKRSGESLLLQGDGGVRETQAWVDDLPTGHWAKYDEDGKKQEEGQLDGGARVGLWTRYNVLGDVAQRWMEPADGGSGPVRDGGLGLDGPGGDAYFAGMTVREWRIRLAEVTQASEVDPSLIPLRALTLHRAALAGLRVDAGRLEEPEP